MRKLFASLVVWSAGLSCPLGLNAQDVHVMQWNVERGLGRSSNNTNAEAQAIARIVNYNQPDILLFNEIDCSNGLSVASNESAITAWATNYVPYLGTLPGVTFFVKASSSSDGFIRNAVLSRFPILVEGTYTSSSMIRGLHAFQVQLEGTNMLQVFHAHFKCCGSGASSECSERQTNAVFASNTIRSWAATNSLPYIFAGDWNEDESNPQCTLLPTYRPITMVRTNGNLVEFRPTNLDGGSNYKTISSASPVRRFDYCLAGSNRLSAVTGSVFNAANWASHGLYTNAISQYPATNLVNDSQTASDHLTVFVNYFFPTSITNFTVTPTNAFVSSGNTGGPFGPSSQIYTLTNSDTIPLFWSVTKTSSWLTVSALATNLTLGAGRGTNITATINSSANSLDAGTYVDEINFSNTATGVSLSRGVTLTVNATPPAANFSGSPTNGTNPLAVTFIDTSTGTITNRFWDFGDNSGTTNVTTNSVAHTYAAGTYTVTLIASGPLGASTNTKPDYITVIPPPSTLNVDAADLEDRFANLIPTNSVAVLVADAGNNGFTDPEPGFALSLGAMWGDDRVVGLWDLRDTFLITGLTGYLNDQTVVNYTNGIAPGQRLQLYWFPSLTLASNTVGVTYYGKYTDTNSPPLDFSDNWQIPVAGSSIYLEFLTVSEGGSNPDAAGQATYLTSAPLTDFENWQIQYFGSTNNTAASSVANPDGDGQNNMAEFLSGTNPTNSASSFRITSVATQGSNVLVSWATAGGRTNALQATAGSLDGSYSTNFLDISPLIIIPGSVDITTNWTDTGGATNTPSRYYRVRLVP